MKGIKFLWSLLFLVFIISCTTDDAPVSPENPTDRNIQNIVDTEYENYINKYPGYVGGIAIHVTYSGGESFAFRGFPEGLTKYHHFRAQSITKTFTAAGIMLLHQRGKLNIRNYITDKIPGTNLSYVPDSTETWKYNVPYKNQIRIWDLLTHRSGLFDPENDDTFYKDSVFASNPIFTFTPDDVIGYVSRLQLSYFPPGDGWHYSNAGYVMLAKIIERVSGISYRQFMTDEFVIPLELNETSFPELGTDINLPSPYVDSWYWSSAYSVNTTEQNMTYNIGEGNMISSTNDLNKFFEYLFSGQAGISLLNVTNYMMDCRYKSDVGSGEYGTGVEKFSGLGYGHGGDGAGMSIKSIYDPDKKIMITTFINCWNYKDGVENQSYFIEQQYQMYDLLYKIKAEISN